MTHDIAVRNCPSYRNMFYHIYSVDAVRSQSACRNCFSPVFFINVWRLDFNVPTTEIVGHIMNMTSAVSVTYDIILSNQLFLTRVHPAVFNSSNYSRRSLKTFSRPVVQLGTVNKARKSTNNKSINQSSNMGTTGSIWGL